MKSKKPLTKVEEDANKRLIDILKMLKGIQKKILQLNNSLRPPHNTPD